MNVHSIIRRVRGIIRRAGRAAAVLCCAVLPAGVWAQFAVNGAGQYLLLTDAAMYNLDALVIINGITSACSVDYTGGGSVKWTYTVGGETYSSTQQGVIPEDGVLYTVEAGGTEYAVYVIDYAAYRIVPGILTWEEDEEVKCQTLYLRPEVEVPEMRYRDRNGTERVLQREFTLTYTDSKWAEADEVWADEAKEVQVTLPQERIQIDAPKKDTQFVLRGDQWAEQMGIATDSIVSDEYAAIAVEAHPKGTVVEREGLNEMDRSDDEDVRGSGPLVVDFESRVNPIGTVFYEWYVWDVQKPNNYTRYTDQNFQYTFEDTGEYWAKIVATSEGCEFVDSVSIRVLESMINVPNVFTPNGDGINDEFRVAYRSLATYRIVIKNRWGRTVYVGDDPSKGWDGRIGGAQAADGTYYYVIFATGTDVDEDGKPIRYKLSGDINLLRGL